MTRAAALAGVVLLLGTLVWIECRSEAPVAPDSSVPVAQPLSEREPALAEEPKETPIVVTEPRREVAPAALAPEAGITLLVTDLSDVPIPGARVEILDRPRELFRTDADGTCSLPLDGSGDTVPLRVEADGYFHYRHSPLRRESLHVRPDPTVTLVGRVLDSETDAPLTGARIYLIHNGCRGCPPEIFDADPDGAYELHGASPKEHAVYFGVEAEGYARCTFSVPLSADRPAAEHDFRLSPGIPVSGRIVAWGTGEPIEGVLLHAWVNEVEARTDATGSFRLRVPDLGPDGLEFSIFAEGYCGTGCNWRLDELSEPLEIELVPSASLEGVVHDTTGTPLEGALVTVGDVDRIAERRALAAGETPPARAEATPGCRYGAEDRRAKGVTDAEGRFRIDGIEPWSPWSRVRVEREGYRTLQEIVGSSVPPKGVARKELVLTPVSGASIVGSVTLNGEGWPGGLVSWRGDDRSGMESLDAEGGYRLSDVEPGAVRLRFDLQEDQGLAPFLDGYEVDLVVPPGGEVRHDFEFSIPISTIRGRVVLAKSRLPAAAARVVARAVEGPQLARFVTSTPESGEFTLRVPSSVEAYELSVACGKNRVQGPVVAPGTGGLEIVVSALGTLRYRAHDEETGRDVAADVYLRTDQGAFQDRVGRPWIRPDAEGWRSIEVQEGVFDVMLRSDDAGYIPRVHEGVVVSEGRTTDLRVVLKKGLEIRLELAPGAKPIPVDHMVFLLEEAAWEGVRVDLDSGAWDGGEAYPEDTAFYRMAIFDGSSATLRGLSPGSRRFKVFPDDVRIEPERVELSSASSRVEVGWAWVR